jgi:hypothetical protein
MFVDKQNPNLAGAQQRVGTQKGRHELNRDLQDLPGLLLIISGLAQVQACGEA